MEQKITNFLKQRIGDDVLFKQEDDIFQLGLVSSIFSLQLITFLENEFSIRVENEDLKITNFNSVKNIMLFLRQKNGLT